MTRSLPPPPRARPDDEVRVFFGTEVVTPFRWLEDAETGEVADWIRAQNERTTAFFRTTRKDYFTRFLAEQWREAPKILPIETSSGVYFVEQAPEQDRPAFFLRTLDGERRRVFDPNASSHPPAALDAERISVSPSGRYAAIPLSDEGQEGAAIHFWDAQAERMLPEIIRETAVPTVAWHPREHGFFYNVTRTLIGCGTEQQPDGLYWHRLGTSPESDTLLLEHSGERSHGLHPCISDGGHLLVFAMNYVTACRGITVFPLPDQPGDRLGRGLVLLEEAEAPVVLLGSQHDARGQDSVLYFATWLDAPRGRVIAVDLDSPSRDRWREIVPETDGVLETESYAARSPTGCLIAGRLVLAYLHDGHHRVRSFDLQGRDLGELPLPGPCTVYQLAACGGASRSSVELGIVSVLEPYVRYRFDPGTGVLASEARWPSPLAPSDFEIEQLFVRSRDGTRVPMTVVARRGLQRDGSAPAFLYGYGGWGQALTPRYYPEVALWLHLGGVYAYANLRGGGEYGQAWREAGMKEKKQNVFDDFQAVAEYLTSRGYTSPRRLGIKGLSNGGLLTAACYNQRPDLYGAVISEIPLVDVLALGDSEKGRAVAAELGNPRESREMFAAIRAYSPLHNVTRAAHKPPLLIVVAERDGSAPPGQALRFAAACQAAAEARDADSGDPLILLRVVPSVGHVGWLKGKLIATLAEEIAFFHELLAGDGTLTSR